MPEHPFSDLTGNHHAPAIGCLVWWDVASGYPDATYRPAEVVNRAQMAGFVARSLRASGVELPPPDTPFFTDLGNDVHAPDIEALREAGVIGGVAGTTHEITIRKSAAAGFAHGYADDTYRPGNPVRRDHMGAFLARMLNRLVDLGHAPPRD